MGAFLLPITHTNRLASMTNNLNHTKSTEIVYAALCDQLHIDLATIDFDRAQWLIGAARAILEGHHERARVYLITFLRRT